VNADLSMIQHHRADLDGLRMHFVEAGTGPALVLLHGFPETWYAWRHQIAPLAQHYRLIVPDLRGYGATDKPASGYDKRTMANDIRRLLQHLGIEKASIVGHYRGARVGTRFVKDHPEAVDRFAALDNIPTKVIFASMNAAFAQFGWFFLFHSVPHLPQALVQGREEMWLRYIFRNWTYNPEALSDADIAVYTQAYAQPGGLHGAFSDYSAWRQDLEQDYADADKRLACPTMALWGTEFAGAKMMDMAKLWNDLASDLKVAPIPLSGHLPHEEQPEQVTAALLEFLQP
jgi:haloacetate dehalogenase